jgi:hypothetical protein
VCNFEQSRRQPEVTLPPVGEAQPRPGDIVIHRQIHSPAVYLLSTLGGPLQLSFNTYEKAAIRAVAFASEKHLDAWYTTDEQTFKQVVQHRPE